MPDIPTTEPVALRVGDTWKWTKKLADYPAGDWVLKYLFKSAAGGFEIVCSASGTDHAVVVSASTSANYGAGAYTWTAWVEGGDSEKHTVDSGSCTLAADYRAGAAAAGLDDRSHAQKMLDAIEAWLESRDPGVAEYEIAGRRMKYIPPAELVKLHNRYKNAVEAEKNAAAIARGEGIGRKIQFRI